MLSRFRPVLFVIAVAAIVLGSQWLANRNDNKIVQGPDVTGDPESASSDVVRAQHPSLSESLGVGESDFVEVGGVKRPKRDVAFENSTPKQVDSEKSRFPHPGNAPNTPKDANPQVKQLFEELSKEVSERNPAAVSSLFSEKFDAKAFEKDKQKWLSQIRPSRAFQSAQPGPEVEPIQSTTAGFQRIVQGEKVAFEVKAQPGAPVTFYTPQVGTFTNELSTHSVEANENGIARTTYTATAGANGLIDVVAASPLNSGLLRYKIQVSLPQ